MLFGSFSSSSVFHRMLFDPGVSGSYPNPEIFGSKAHILWFIKLMLIQNNTFVLSDQNQIYIGDPPRHFGSLQWPQTWLNTYLGICTYLKNTIPVLFKYCILDFIQVYVLTWKIPYLQSHTWFPTGTCSVYKLTYLLVTYLQCLHVPYLISHLYTCLCSGHFAP